MGPEQPKAQFMSRELPFANFLGHERPKAKAWAPNDLLYSLWARAGPMQGQGQAF